MTQRVIQASLARNANQKGAGNKPVPQENPSLSVLFEPQAKTLSEDCTMNRCARNKKNGCCIRCGDAALTMLEKHRRAQNSGSLCMSACAQGLSIPLRNDSYCYYSELSNKEEAASSAKFPKSQLPLRDHALKPHLAL